MLYIHIHLDYKLYVYTDYFGETIQLYVYIQVFRGSWMETTWWFCFVWITSYLTTSHLGIRATLLSLPPVFLWVCFIASSFCVLTESQKFSKDGCEQHMQVNHLAPALLTVLLLPSLARGAPSRVVMVNSIVSSPCVCLSLNPKALNLSTLWTCCRTGSGIRSECTWFGFWCVVLSWINQNALN